MRLAKTLAVAGFCVLLLVEGEQSLHPRAGYKQEKKCDPNAFL
jgi:hypothetical protein